MPRLYATVRVNEYATRKPSARIERACGHPNSPDATAGFALMRSDLGQDSCCPVRSPPSSQRPGTPPEHRGCPPPWPQILIFCALGHSRFDGVTHSRPTRLGLRSIHVSCFHAQRYRWYPSEPKNQTCPRNKSALRYPSS